jgi:uncharacterized delta-60 repeat protein
MCRRPCSLAPAVAVALALAGPFAGLHAQSPGALDASFAGGDGVRVFEPNGTTTNTLVQGVAARADGFLWVAGSVLTGDFDPFCCRVSSDGSSTMCLTIAIDLSPSASDHVRDVAVSADGKPVLVGDAGGPPGDTDMRALFIRLTNAGGLDAGFGGDGIVDDFNLSSPFSAQAVAVQPDGKVVWAGYVDQSLFGIPNRNILVGRLLANGTPDPSFDGDGFRVVLVDAGGDLADAANDVALQPDGKIVVVGSAAVGDANANQEDFAVVRLHANGSLDTSFSGDGEALISFDGGLPDGAHTVAVDRLGRIVVAGQAGGFDLGAGVVRLLPDGTLDATFGSGGKTELSILTPGDPRGKTHVLLLPGDSILVAGNFDPDVGGDDSDSFVAVLEPDGDLDPTFGGGDGKVTFASLPQLTDPAPTFGGAVLWAGKVLVGGDAGFAESDLAFALRLWMSRLFRDDFETGDKSQWSGSAGS